LVAPTPDSLGDDDDFPVPQSAVDPQLHSSCDNYKDIFREAWSEAGEIAKAPLKWSRWNKFQNALNDYVGPTSGNIPWFSDDIWRKYNRRSRVFTTISFVLFFFPAILLHLKAPQNLITEFTTIYTKPSITAWLSTYIHSPTTCTEITLSITNCSS
jgi:hypothetical protein